MRFKKTVSKFFYWIVIFSIILSNVLPATYISARGVEGENINLGEKQLTETQKDESVFFNFLDENSDLNEERADYETGVIKGQVITAQEIKAKALSYKKIGQKQDVRSIKDEEVATEKEEVNSTLKQNRAYFDNLISRLNLSQPKNLSEAKSRGWRAIDYETTKPVEDLVIKVPKELLVSTESTVDMRDRKKRAEVKQRLSLPTLSLQSEYLIFFAKQGVNPIGQNLKINNRGEGTLNYTLSENISWLDLDLTSGSVITETDVANVSINTGGLTHASSPYVGEIQINNLSNSDDTELVKVRLIISENENFNGAFSYDANNNLRRRIDAEGNGVEYGYDSLNRLVKVTYPDSNEVIFTYDENGNRTSMTDQSGATNYYYDQFDRLYAVQYPGINPIIYEYDKADRIIKITYPDQQEVHYAYDSDDRLISVKT